MEAVLAAAGQGAGRRPAVLHLAGLSDREIEVLGLIARGATNRAAARSLGISAKTVGHHVGHIYTKIGVTTRPAAALFAMEHDLLRWGVRPMRPSAAPQHGSWRGEAWLLARRGTWR